MIPTAAKSAAQTSAVPKGKAVAKSKAQPRTRAGDASTSERNAFDHRLRGAPPRVKEEWSVVKTDLKNPYRQDLFNAILSSSRGDYSAATLTIQKHVEQKSGIAQVLAHCHPTCLSARWYLKSKINKSRICVTNKNSKRPNCEGNKSYNRRL